MSIVTIKNHELEIFKKILKNGYVVEDGKETKRIVREMKHARVPIHHGFDQGTKKVIVALERPFVIKSKRRTLSKTCFELDI